MCVSFSVENFERESRWLPATIHIDEGKVKSAWEAAEWPSRANLPIDTQLIQGTSASGTCQECQGILAWACPAPDY